MKHVLRRHFFVRAAEADEAIEVVPVDSASNMADILTKWTDGTRFKEMLARLRKRFE